MCTSSKNGIIFRVYDAQYHHHIHCLLFRFVFLIHTEIQLLEETWQTLHNLHVILTLMLHCYDTTQRVYNTLL